MTAQVQEEQPTSLVRTGTVLSIAYSPELINNIGKQPQQEAEITRWGIPGDRHYGETRISKGRVVPNNRPITVCGVEGGREACAALGVPDIPYGGLGENLLTEGLGDLGDAMPGDQIQVLDESGQPKVILEVGSQNDPCSNTMIYHKQMVKQLYHKRGVLCTVLKEGHVRIGDPVALVRQG